jgi:hypothetical protein
MRAHYLAGIAAYDADRRAVAAEMFTHPISEIYVDLEEVLVGLGAPEFGDVLATAAAAPNDGSTDEQIRAHVDTVLAAIDSAEAYAPDSGHSEASIAAQVAVNMIMRAALQYEFAANADMHNGPYLDGFGFHRAAEVMTQRHLDEIRALDAGTADALLAALAALAEAYPTAIAPTPLDADSDQLIALAEAASAAAERLE